MPLVSILSVIVMNSVLPTHYTEWQINVSYRTAVQDRATVFCSAYLAEHSELVGCAARACRTVLWLCLSLQPALPILMLVHDTVAQSFIHSSHSTHWLSSYLVASCRMYYLLWTLILLCPDHITSTKIYYFYFSNIAPAKWLKSISLLNPFATVWHWLTPLSLRRLYPRIIVAKCNTLAWHN